MAADAKWADDAPPHVLASQVRIPATDPDLVRTWSGATYSDRRQTWLILR